MLARGVNTWDHDQLQILLLSMPFYLPGEPVAAAALDRSQLGAGVHRPRRGHLSHGTQDGRKRLPNVS